MCLEYPPDEFDAWAENYDQSVKDESVFPFEGYTRVLETVFEQAAPSNGLKVLDLGIGTGNLAHLFVEAGCEVWGLDFSTEMVRLARQKFPEVHLAAADVRGALDQTWPADFLNRYDRIVSGYTFHHFPMAEKVRLVQVLKDSYLLEGGRIVIGDVAFADAARQSAYAAALGDAWEQEYYWLADEASLAFASQGIQAAFILLSACAGVFSFSA